jgi:hypothetical protein
VNTSEVNEARRHEPQLVLSEHVHHRVHGGGTAGRLNSRLAVAITRSVGTMWTAYLFAALALVSLPAALASHSVIVIVAWVAQTFLQLVLLPIIIVGQNVIQSASDVRAQADHKTLTAIHRLTVDVHALNEAQIVMLEELRRRG